MSTRTETLTKTATIGDQEVPVERVSARKASRALALLRALTRATPQLQEELAVFRRKYQAEHFIELDRTQARHRFPARPLLDTEGEVATGENGAVLYMPSPIDGMSEADWEKSGHKLRLPQSPSFGETVAALFDTALELAEEHVYLLLALFLTSNDDVKRYAREGGDALRDKLSARAEDLLDDAYGDELLELAAVCGELVDEQFRKKAEELGDRLGNALSLFGLEPKRTTPADPSLESESSDGPSSSTPPSSTASPERMPGGDQTPSSSSNGTSSTSSGSSSTPTPPPSEQQPTENASTEAAEG